MILIWKHGGVEHTDSTLTETIMGNPICMLYANALKCSRKMIKKFRLFWDSIKISDVFNKNLKELFDTSMQTINYRQS